MLHPVPTQDELEPDTFIELLDPKVIESLVYIQARSICQHYLANDVDELCVYPVMSGAMYYAPKLMTYISELQGPAIRVIKEMTEARGKNLLIVDTIYDTGKTKSRLNAEAIDAYAKTINWAFLIHKTRMPDDSSWAAYRVPEVYVYGFGLDDDAGLARELPYIGYDKK